jgi:hypothetical protein
MERVRLIKNNPKTADVTVALYEVKTLSSASVFSVLSYGF